MEGVSEKDISPAWLTLIISLPTQNATLRMRIWRTLKGMGCAALRDGVYLLPERAEHVEIFSNLAEEIKKAGGSAHILSVDSRSEDFKTLFDRSAEYASLKNGIVKFRASLKDIEHASIGRLIKGLRRDFDAIAKVDFFPAEAKKQAEAALVELEVEAAALVVIPADERHIGSIAITRLDPAAYQGRLWATRKHPWIDRLASAWLIQRFIDPGARFLWLEKPPEGCPEEAVGFDYSGAAFSHSGNYVTFETLVQSFGLASDAALMRMASLVHFLDIGGIPAKEASGLEAILLGAKRKCADDDSLLAEAMATFDYLYAAYLEK